jgi:uncharacterized membrane protein YdbT with pleckstrin-like domain
MPDVVVRPTLKFIKAGYVLVLLLVLAAIWFDAKQDRKYDWLPAVAALLILWPIERHLRRQMRKMVITGDQLRYEAGFLSRTTRTISLAKVQDVTVQQTLWQRLTATGDLAIETAGKDSWEAMRSIDRPQAVADQLHQASVAAGRLDPLGPGPNKGQIA